MQFVANGPDIPDQLLQSHEEGRVVFFCGAGISYPAGLPGFGGLVDRIYGQVGTVPNEIEKKAYDNSQYDAMLDLLERRVTGGRQAVRRALAKSLKPNLRLKGARDTHDALLQLACRRDGTLRLVTTNFDHIFEKRRKRHKKSINTYAAPMLPIPKNSRWDGLVYLHGLLPDRPEASDPSMLNRLVVTSGDFGLAYLTERWAARFVSELFRNYVVCFVGYSINDPVLRYMMDALAADRMLGEITPQAYAMGDCNPGQEHPKTVEWEAKGVIPILYEVPAGTQDHSLLHQTLKSWSNTYRDGFLGKERIVVDYAMTRPSASTQQDDFVGRMLWALSDSSGLPARRFAEFDPVPSLDWLEAFSTDPYRHNDLVRFNVPPHTEVDENLRFSLIRRPAPYTCSPWMTLVSSGAMEAQWDQVMSQLARWLVRHLDDPALILWVAQQGGQLHNQLKRLIERELDRFSQLELEGNLEELSRIRSQAPSAIPRPLLRPLWRLFLTGQVKLPQNDLHLNTYSWKDRLKREGPTATLRLELRKLLAPKIVLREPFRWLANESETDVPDRLKQLIDWELVLAGNHVRSSFLDIARNEYWHSALPALFDDLQQLLRDALDLLRELNEADDHNDHSHWDLPSVSPHWQNRGFRDLGTLIELVRDAWLAIRDIDINRASNVAKEWFDVPYPTFKRLALFAASQGKSVPPDQWVGWLVSDGGWWMWSVETGRETYRLLVLQGCNLTPRGRKQLEATILAGPPRAMLKEGVDPERWQDLLDREVWRHLAKLQSSGSELGLAAAQRLAVLSAAHSQWSLAENESDEFSHWMSSTGDPDHEGSRDIDLAPGKRAELVEWLNRPRPSQRPFYEDNWRETCRTRFVHCAYALCDLAKEGQWPSRYWREALQAWSEEKLLPRSWKLVAPLVGTMPDKSLGDLAHSVTWWLKAISKSLNRHEDIFLDLCQRILLLPHQDDIDTDQPVSRAINHPVGHVTEALLNLWFRGTPNDNDGLPDDLEPFFSQMCDTGIAQFRDSRVLLASRLIALFRVDGPWTEDHLLPLFDWQRDPNEARAAWEGFLWSPRLYKPLLIALKQQFLDTAHHYNELGEHARQFATFLTYAGLDPADTYGAQDFQAALGALPPQGLLEASRALVKALEGSGEQREDYWVNRIAPFWHDIWPKSRELASRDIGETLARLSIAARGQFPAALAVVLDWLQPVADMHYVTHLLDESGLSERFPEDALRLLDAVLGNPQWVPTNLAQCLTAIVQAAPGLQDDPRYQRLLQYMRRHDA